MKTNNRVIFIIITVLAALAPILYLLQVLEAPIAFPIMFTMIGVQQLYSSLFLIPEEQKSKKETGIIFGSTFTFFGLVIVLPYYLFFN